MKPQNDLISYFVPEKCTENVSSERGTWLELNKFNLEKLLELLTTSAQNVLSYFFSEDYPKVRFVLIKPWLSYGNL